ncbi:MAG: hypothetical protein V4717_13390 [Bacteroidota bacterium]
MIIKFISALVLVMLLAYTAFLFSNILPWWAFTPVVLLVGIVVPQRPWLSWLTGFIGVLFCWGLLVFTMSSDNGHLLATKMATVLPLKGSYYLLMFISAFIGAVIGGFSSLTGTYLRRIY